MKSMTFDEIFDLILQLFGDSEGDKISWRTDMQKCINHPKKAEIIAWIKDSECLPYIRESDGAIVYESIWKRELKELIDN